MLFNMRKSIYLFFFLFGLILSCKTSREVVDIDQFVDLDTITISANSPLDIYRASEPKIIDLIHTKLDVRFDWDSSFLFGDAELSLKPYYYPISNFQLDAKGFDIHGLFLLDSIDQRTELNYEYDGKIINIQLPKEKTKEDTFRIKIRYTAKPNALESGGSDAITNDIGLYFINPDGKDENKPKQIWTQGETEANSCWFPTVDQPNEKMTQEFFITVDSSFTTLSNGELLFQTENADGTRTDYWEQTLPHAPYLSMMAIGKYAIVSDEWRDKPVNYYVEPQYKSVARKIFPNTLEMLDFFSMKLGYDYPWYKYDQVVVRDYVSGAMENTSAVIYGEFVQGDARYLIDNSYEDVVAHELFHHWFGDLVTCESWSNIPLNEAFATYGEYLWIEHKYGQDAADYHLDQQLNNYLQEARIERKKLIRFHYEKREDMFDSHSYEKGGHVLHMLRREVGDAAFFDALALYLDRYAFQATEIHHLRLVFEEVTGRDLNWFFNQWFLAAGHPVIKVYYDYSPLDHTLSVTTQQTQEGEAVPDVFQLSTDIEVMTPDGRKVLPINIMKRKQTFEFDLLQSPVYVKLDAQAVLLAEIDQPLSIQEAKAFYRSNNYYDRLLAVKKAKNGKSEDAMILIKEALNDSFWDIRVHALEGSEKLSVFDPDARAIIKTLCSDPKSDVRAAAYEALASNYEDKTDIPFLKKGLKDSSYLVVSYALESLYFLDEQVALEEARVLENLDNVDILLSLAYIYSEQGNPELLSFYQSKIKSVDSYSKYSFVVNYGDFIAKQEIDLVSQSLSDFEEVGIKENLWWVRMGAVNALINIKEKQEELIAAIRNQILTSNDQAEVFKLEKRSIRINGLIKEIKNSLLKIKAVESEENILRMINSVVRD